LIKETLEIGGEAYVSETEAGDGSGLFLYDDYEVVEKILGLDSRILLIVKFYYSIRGLLMYL
jgi:hypothetical protein